MNCMTKYVLYAQGLFLEFPSETHVKGSSRYSLSHEERDSNEMVLRTGANNALIMHSNMIKISVPLCVTVPVGCGHNTRTSSQPHSGNKHVAIITLSREGGGGVGRSLCVYVTMCVL